jgi:glycosyltransferase involved in cell wall biosynthesis
MPKISFLCPDISAPTIGAALKLARYLEPDYETEIIGPDFGRGVCSLYQGSFPFTSVPAGRLYRLPDYLWERRRLARAIGGNVVIAVKGFASTVPVALSLKKARGIPVAVYLDEWDGALWHEKSTSEKIRNWLAHGHHPMEPCYHPWVERRIRKADLVLSTTTWLQRRFGGEILHAGVDCGFFEPQPADQVAALKKSLGLAGCNVIVFGGVVRPHKGVEEILEAMMHVARKDLRLLVVGPVTEHLEALMNDARFGGLVKVAGDAIDSGTSLNSDIHRQMPLYLDVGDLVILALRDTPLAQSQMPIKIFEAMAMAKPVIGTAVADLPHLLKDSGWVVDPGDSEALARAIQYALDHPEECRARGARARQVCVEQFNREIVGNQFKSLMRSLFEQGGKRF